MRREKGDITVNDCVNVLDISSIISTTKCLYADAVVKLPRNEYINITYVIWQK